VYQKPAASRIFDFGFEHERSTPAGPSFELLIEK
jgi:hypothetical protein